MLSSFFNRFRNGPETLERCRKICYSFGTNLDRPAVEAALSRLTGSVIPVVWARSPQQAARIVEGRHFSRLEVSPWACASAQVTPPHELLELSQSWGRFIASSWYPELSDLPEPLPSCHDVLGLGLWSAPQLIYQSLTGRGTRVDRLAGEVAAAGAWGVWLGRTYHLALAPPVEVHLDEHQLLHRADGPALVWPDGECSWSFRGRRMPPHRLRKPGAATVEEIIQARDHASREALIELIGYSRLLEELDWSLVDMDLDGQGQLRHLLRLDLPLQPVVLVRVSCPSTGQVSLLRVPPYLTCCKAAVAWTFEFEDPEEFTPRVET